VVHMYGMAIVKGLFQTCVTKSIRNPITLIEQVVDTAVTISTEWGISLGG